MPPKRFMLIAGEASGDLLAAELVKALASPPFTNHQSPFTFFGAGGPKMAGAGVELAFDMTQHSVIGLWEVLKNYGKFTRLFDQLLRLAIARRPDVIVCVDFSGFNRRFAHAIRQRLRLGHSDWHPRIVQYVSPQVWASRPGRANKMARDIDLLLTIFPFEKDWYAKRTPGLRVEFVGHPMIDRFQIQNSKFKIQNDPPLVLLLPGSRVGELRRHLPVLLEAARLIRSKGETSFRMVLPDAALADCARQLGADENLIQLQTGHLADALSRATIAIASTGTVTMECAWFGVPTVALYKTSWSTYQIGRRIVQVKHLAMPNLLAGGEIFPEFIQDAATPGNLARAALELLSDDARRAHIQVRLAEVIATLGGPGASARAAGAVVKLL